VLFKSLYSLGNEKCHHLLEQGSKQTNPLAFDEKNPGKESRGIGSGNAYNFKIKISLGACRIVPAPRKCNQGIT